MKTKFPVPVLVIIVIIAAATILYAYYVNFPHYSDSKMEAHFLNNEADFNRLVEMFGEDSELNMIMDGEADGEPISMERLEQYKTLVDKIKIGYEIRRMRDDKAPKIIFVSTSFSELDENHQYHISSKGFIYSPAEAPKTDGYTKFKKIKENWYLYYTEGTIKIE